MFRTRSTGPTIQVLSIYAKDGKEQLGAADLKRIITLGENTSLESLPPRQKPVDSLRSDSRYLLGRANRR